ncbi:hypothetical protein KFK09_027680 [Dendrobium nobile]|uniref:Piwi domain-containing protein n=1 Tax=Dendrobium nobile TaxID=94219 RepID=A0A8T3A116_DENNO|nr:hypothetical protein KFK09_027680 [Dendrobium nobile]
MGLSLNIDMSSTAFIEPLPVIEFVAQILGKDVISRPLSDADRVKKFNREPVIPIYSARPDQVEKALKHVFNMPMNKLKGKELELLLAILPDSNGSLYGDLKRICEADFGLISQCCLTKHVFKINKQYLANVSLKINVKMGRRNTVLLDAISWRIPLVCDKPTIIFGADVTHPETREYSSPSIAAVCASQDWPEVTKYAGLVCAQAHRQELIQDLYKTWHDPQRGTLTGGMIRELLISFRKATGQKPMRIIFYRDGVSEGQFYQVLLYELDAIRKACASLEPNYQPLVTFVVVQKRHHTRLYVNNHKDRNSSDKSGNILLGTVVDSKICHPIEFDFYLCSHAGIQVSLIRKLSHSLFSSSYYYKFGLVMVKLETTLKLKCLKSDNGGECRDKKFNEYYDLNGIRHEFIVLKTPQHNGVKEHINITSTAYNEHDVACWSTQAVTGKGIPLNEGLLWASKIQPRPPRRAAAVLFALAKGVLTDKFWGKFWKADGFVDKTLPRDFALILRGLYDLSSGFDANKERIGAGHNRYFVVPFGGKTTRFRGPRVITVYPAMPFGGKPPCRRCRCRGRGPSPPRYKSVYRAYPPRRTYRTGFPPTVLQERV